MSNKTHLETMILQITQMMFEKVSAGQNEFAVDETF